MNTGDAKSEELLCSYEYNISVLSSCFLATQCILLWNKYNSFLTMFLSFPRIQNTNARFANWNTGHIEGGSSIYGSRSKIVTGTFQLGSQILSRPISGNRCFQFPLQFRFQIVAMIQSVLMHICLLAFKTAVTYVGHYHLHSLSWARARSGDAVIMAMYAATSLPAF